MVRYAGVPILFSIGAIRWFQTTALTNSKNSNANDPSIKSCRRRSVLILHVTGCGRGTRCHPRPNWRSGSASAATSCARAVKSLETLGILESRTGAGLFVHNFSFIALMDQLQDGVMFNMDEVIDLLEVRFYLEYWLIERIVHTVGEAQLGRLEAILEDMRQSAERGEYATEADRAFHLVLGENSGNAVLKKILDTWRAMHLAGLCSGQIPQPRDPMENYLGHRAIFDALKARDVEAMQKSLIHHTLPALNEDRLDPKIMRSSLIRRYIKMALEGTA